MSFSRQTKHTKHVLGKSTTADRKSKRRPADAPLSLSSANGLITPRFNSFRLINKLLASYLLHSGEESLVKQGRKLRLLRFLRLRRETSVQEHREKLAVCYMQ